MTERIFDGLKVIDCASFIAGPAAATVMSDFGAEVIKIEPPGAGDPYRRRAVPIPGRPGDQPRLCARRPQQEEPGARPARRAGRAVLYRLVRETDVFITNYPPPVRQRLKITYEDLAPLNERLIYASFTGYGETGPEANKPGFDATAWWARTGLMHLVRAGEEATPARSLPGMGDHPSSMGTYGAIVTALYQRERTGKGNYVSSSLLANGLWANGCSVQAALCGDQVAPQPPREAAINALRVVTRCRCGRWLLLSNWIHGRIDGVGHRASERRRAFQDGLFAGSAPPSRFTVIARSAATKQSRQQSNRRSEIASRSLSSGRPQAGPVGSQ